MARRKKVSTTERSLLDAWHPPADAGRPVAALATTFEFEAAFYERELLTRFVGCNHDAFDDELLFFVEREQRLSDTYAAVLVDSGHVDGARMSARWDQMPVHVPTGCMHAKVSVLAWERRIRLIVGSANLTPAGYRTNHEIAYVLDFLDSEDSPPRTVLLAFLDALARYAGLNPGEQHAEGRLRAALHSVRVIVDGWLRLPAQTSRRAPLQLVPIFVEPQGELSYFDAIREAVGTTKFDDCWIMSPFWDDPAPGTSAPTDPACAGLRDLLRVRTAQVTVMARGARNGEGQTFVEAPERVRDTLMAVVGSDDVFVAPVVFQPGQVGGERRLHAKGLWLSDGDHRVLVAGSSNFTAAGTGAEDHRCNVEANIALLVRDGVPEYDLVHKLGPPYEPESSGADAHWQGAPKDGEEGEDVKACKPPFLVAATWCVLERKLEIDLLTPPAKSLVWQVGLPADESLEVLWASTHPREPGVARTFKLVEVHASGPRVLRLEWERPQGTSFAFVPVTIKDRARLPPADAMRPLTMDELLDLFVSGKQVWEIIRRALAPSGSDVGHADALDPHKLVNTSRYLTTRTRRFSRALAALQEQLTAVPFTMLDSLRARLFGATGPQALARTIAQEAGLSAAALDSHSTPSLPAELGIFFLAELALVLRRVGAPTMLDPSLQSAAEGEWEKLRSALEALLDESLRMRPPGPDLTDYARRAGFNAAGGAQ